MAVRAWLANPWETAAFLGLLAAGAVWPHLFLAAALFFCGAEILAARRGAAGGRWWPAWWPDEPRPVVILYDATCVLCTRSKARLETWRTASAMRFVPLQSEEARALVPGMDGEAFLGQMHAVEDGRVSSGADGWYRIMARAPWPLALLAACTPRWIARPVYRWVARNRFRWFGRVCSEAGCAVHPKP